MPLRLWFQRAEREKDGKDCKQQDQAWCMKAINTLEKNINIACWHNYSLGQFSGSTRSYISGNNTSEIVHLTKGSCIIESNVAIKTCLTASEWNIERQGFKVNAHLSNSSSNANLISKLRFLNWTLISTIHFISSILFEVLSYSRF